MLEQAESGRELLEDRLGTLIDAFSRYARGLLASRQDLANLVRESYRRLILAKVFDKGLLERLLILSPKKRGVIIRTENIGGINIPLIQSVSEIDKPFPFRLSSERIDKTIEAFDSQIDLIIDLATQESTIMRLGRVIQKIRTRYNALEQILIPELKQHIREIDSILEEKERNELYRLRLFLKKKELQAKTNRDKIPSSVGPPIQR